MKPEPYELEAFMEQMMEDQLYEKELMRQYKLYLKEKAKEKGQLPQDFPEPRELDFWLRKEE
jgi:hypothetical protein